MTPKRSSPCFARRASARANGIKGQLTTSSLEATLEATDREATVSKLLELPVSHFLVLTASSWTQGREIEQPVTTADVHSILEGETVPADLDRRKRAVRGVLSDLERRGLVEMETGPRGREAGSPGSKRRSSHGGSATAETATQPSRRIWGQRMSRERDGEGDDDSVTRGVVARR